MSIRESEWTRSMIPTQGVQGSVYKLTNKRDRSRQLILKSFNERTYYNSELAALKAVQGHQGFPQLFEYSPETITTNGNSDNLTPNKMEIVLECFDLSLEQAAHHLHYKKLVRDQAHSLTLQLLDCVETLHKLGLVHGDLKPDNICLKLRGESLSLYLIDFGLATKFCDDNGNHI